MDAQSVISVDDDDGEGLYSIDVAVRVRPLNHMEQNEVNCVRVMEGGMVVVLDPNKMEGGQEEDYLRQNRSREKRYAFDHAFDENASQHDIYMATTEKLLGGIMDGFNASCFAYGATGAGKTYTMLGNTSQPGCMVLTVGELFKRITSADSKAYRVYLTYLEVYNENIRDLLNPTTGYLDLREDPVKGICVAGITEFTTATVEETMELLHRGNLNRSVEPTKKNETSSRSHAVMQIMVEGKDKTPGLSESVRVGKLSMIDLAGSERASATDNRGARLVEGANINRSLLALANCINALASESEASARAGRNGRRRVRASFVPYRDSKLTRLLKDSFGGNCRTVMISNVSPAGNQYEETVNSLKYANRAKDIKTKVVQNVIEMDHHVVQYQSIIKHLRAQVEELRGQLAANGGPTVLPSIGGAVNARGLRAPSPPLLIESDETDPCDDADSVQVLPEKAVLRKHAGGGKREAAEEMSSEAGEMASRAKGVFKDRAKLLRKLIDMEEAIYSLKIDLAVAGVRRRRAEAAQASGGGDESDDKELEEAEALEAQLNAQVRDRDRSVAALLSKLRENEEATKDLQHAMKRKVLDAQHLERLAMHVRNHILEVQNIELQLRDRAKEHLSERILTEVARDTEVRGWLPKIEIAKRPPSADRQLFTPSSKAPGAAARRSLKQANAPQLTSSRVFQLGSRLGSIAWDMDEHDTTVAPGERPGSRPRSAPTHSPTMTPGKPHHHAPAHAHPDTENLYTEAGAIVPHGRRAEDKGAARQRGGAIILDQQVNQQVDRYKQRLKERQQQQKMRVHAHAHQAPPPDNQAHNPAPNRQGGRKATPEKSAYDKPHPGKRTPEKLVPDRPPQQASGQRGPGKERAGRRRYAARSSADRPSPAAPPAGGGSGRDRSPAGEPPNRDAAVVGAGAVLDARAAPLYRESGLNLDKTEVRAVMKPLQAESQENRLLELQERYNLGKMVRRPCPTPCPLAARLLPFPPALPSRVLAALVLHGVVW